MVANAITLTPGTMTIEVSDDETPIVLYVHVLGLGDPESIREDGWKFEELAVNAVRQPPRSRPDWPRTSEEEHPVNTVTVLCLAMLSIGALLTTVRLVLGPSLADRVVATDLLLTLLTCGAGVQAFRTGHGTFLGAMVVVAILGFLGTSMVARFIERRGA